jgi:hypothetical protein
MLQDGRPYAEIIKKLGRDGKHLTVPNVSRWKDSGYQDWLLDQAFVARIRLAQESAWDLSTGFDATRVTHAALQLATLHIFTALRDLQSGSLDDKLGGDFEAFVRLVNALAHASRETLAVQPRRSTADAFAGALGGLNLSSLLHSQDDEEKGEEAEEEADEEEDQAHTPPPEPDAPPTPKKL